MEHFLRSGIRRGVGSAIRSVAAPSPSATTLHFLAADLRLPLLPFAGHSLGAGLHLLSSQQSRCFSQSSILREEQKQLSVQTITEGARGGRDVTVAVVHGLFGQGRNWRSFTQKLLTSAADETAGMGVRLNGLLFDQRCHGQSPPLPPPHDIESSSSDLVRFFEESERYPWPEVVIGHSLGGKVVLEYLRQLASRDDPKSKSRLPRHLWVLDSVPSLVDGENEDGDIPKIVNALRKSPSVVPRRSEFMKEMLAQGFSRGLVEWMASNLKRLDPGKAEPLTWTFNIEGAANMYESYKQSDYLPFLKSPPPPSWRTVVHIVRAERSERWSDQLLEQLKELAAGPAVEGRGGFEFYTLANAGHWLHVDNPDGLLELVLPSVVDVVENE